MRCKGETSRNMLLLTPPSWLLSNANQRVRTEALTLQSNKPKGHPASRLLAPYADPLPSSFSTADTISSAFLTVSFPHQALTWHQIVQLLSTHARIQHAHGILSEIRCRSLRENAWRVALVVWMREKRSVATSAGLALFALFLDSKEKDPSIQIQETRLQSRGWMGRRSGSRSGRKRKEMLLLIHALQEEMWRCIFS